MQIIRHAAFVATPWKNGGGITHEAIRVPPQGDAFRWRMSVAHIGQSGPFSEFAAYQRIMVLLRGNGVALTFADGKARALRAVGELVEFDGAIQTECELLDGDCVDLNLMVAKALPRAEASVRLIEGRVDIARSSGRSVVIFPLDARIELDDGAGAATLEPWDLAVSAGPVSTEARMSIEARPAARVFIASVAD